MKTALIFAFCAASLSPVLAEDKVTYADDVRPMLENKCFSCHNPDKKKGDLDLTSFAGAMAGGGSGSVINPGDPDGSKLVATVTKKAEPYMPPEGAPLSAKEVELLAHWIQGGVLETKSSLAKKGTPRANIALVTAPKGKPDGPPPVPENVLLEPVVVAPRGTAVTALAASPWAPLVAVSGMKQALVYDSKTMALAGVYPYPEGFIRSLRFSQNGALLVAGGGRGGKSGNAVVWDVKTGRRVTEVGHEFDQVMSADISPNHAMIVIGSPSKKVKCYNAGSGEELYVIKKHTEWVLQVAFSPDGVLLATADRNGGIIISEAANGGEFYVLDGHKAPCTGLAWRSDSNVLASCADDGKVALWEMQNGKLVKSWDAHAGGALAVAFTADGNIVSAGRDGRVRVWDANGSKKSESKPQGDLVTRVAALSDGKVVASGDWTGAVKLWSADKFDELGVISSNPSPIAQRIADTERVANELLAQAPQLEAELKKAGEAVAAKDAQVADAKRKAAEAGAAQSRLEKELKDGPAKIAALEKSRQESQVKAKAQAAAIQDYRKAMDQAARLESDVAALMAEKAKLTAPDQQPKVAELEKTIAGNNAQVARLKQAHPAMPEPPDAFDKAAKEAQAQVAALNKSRPEKEKELAAGKKALEAWPKQIADAEKELADAKAAAAGSQQKLDGLRNRIAWLQKQPMFLRAAQFNVSVLAEREKLEKLEGDIKALQEGLKEAENAKVATARRVEEAKKSIADATTRLPALDAALIKAKADLPGVEKILEPTKAEEAKLLPQVDAQKKIIADNEAAQKNLDQEKANRTAASQKAAEELNKQIAALQKQAGDVNAKAAGPLKAAEEKKAAQAKADEKLNAAKQKLAAATALAQQRDAELKSVEGAQPPSDAAAIAAARKALAEAQAAAKSADGAAQAAQKGLKEAAIATEAAEKVAMPLRSQQQNIAAQIETQKKALAGKQAEPAAVEKEFAAKSQPIQAAIAAAKTALAPLDQKLAELRAKLAADTKTVEAARGAVAKAQGDIDAAKKAQVDGRKTIESSLKEDADREKAVAEAGVDLAKLEPQLGPLQDKVKKLADQYLAMLPK